MGDTEVGPSQNIQNLTRQGWLRWRGGVKEKWGTTELAWEKYVLSEGHVVELEHDSLGHVWRGPSQGRSESSSRRRGLGPTGL